ERGQAAAGPAEAARRRGVHARDDARRACACRCAAGSSRPFDRGATDDELRARRRAMIVDRRLLPHLDWPLLGAVVALMLLGLAMTFTLTWDVRAHAPGREFWTQMYAIAASLVVFVVFLLVDYRTLAQRSLLIYALVALLLVYVTFLGSVHGGSRRWIPLRGFNLQPSEFARVALALVLAMYYGEGRRSARTI